MGIDENEVFFFLKFKPPFKTLYSKPSTSNFIKSTSDILFKITKSSKVKILNLLTFFTLMLKMFWFF